MQGSSLARSFATAALLSCHDPYLLPDGRTATVEIASRTTEDHPAPPTTFLPSDPAAVAAGHPAIGTRRRMPVETALGAALLVLTLGIVLGYIGGYCQD